MTSLLLSFVVVCVFASVDVFSLYLTCLVYCGSLFSRAQEVHKEHGKRCYDGIFLCLCFVFALALIFVFLFFFFALALIFVFVFVYSSLSLLLKNSLPHYPHPPPQHTHTPVSLTNLRFILRAHLSEPNSYLL
jgi:hypothetical protein